MIMRIWDPHQLVIWSMVTLGLVITLWQGWDCTQLYLAQPIRVEEQFVSLAKLPPIQLSICKIFGIDQPADATRNSSTGTVPTFANSTEAFWSRLSARGESFQLGKFISEIRFWNESSSTWDAIFGKTVNNSQVDMEIYPYEGNSTLLCHTLRPGLADFGPVLRLVTTYFFQLGKF